MKLQSYSPTTLLLLLLFCSSCVGVKKYKTLKTENEKIASTLLETKEELSVAKRSLNKLKDQSSSSQEELGASIQDLQVRLQTYKKQLKASEAQVQTLRETSSEQREQFNLQSNQYKERLAPYLKAKSILEKEQSNLGRLYLGIEETITQQPNAQSTVQLFAARLVLSFEHAYLFGSSERSITSAGRKDLEAVAALMNNYSDIHLDILGHTAKSSDVLGAWKSSGRKPLAVLAALLKAGISPKRVRLIAHSQYTPLIADDSKEAALKNTRTELVFHYKGERFVPSLLQP